MNSLLELVRKLYLSAIGLRTVSWASFEYYPQCFGLGSETSGVELTPSIGMQKTGASLDFVLYLVNVRHEFQFGLRFLVK